MRVLVTGGARAAEISISCGARWKGAPSSTVGADAMQAPKSKKKPVTPVADMLNELNNL